MLYESAVVLHNVPMPDWSIGERGFCVALMAVAGLLLALRPPARAARAAWLALLIAGLGYALGLSLLAQNLVNINIVHHYLGAKYAFPYAACYRVINAAVERPQVAMRDLDRPPAMLRDEAREQRAYYIDLLRAAGVEFEPLAPLPELRRRAEQSVALGDEAERILAEFLPAAQIEGFRRDTRLALLTESAERNSAHERRDISWDYGYNGSPLYTLVRRLDPTLHLPFGRATAWLNLGWQILASLLMVWVVGAALELAVEERLAAGALLFASWDFVGWALPGLVFAGLWLPVALALLALRRRRAAAAGLATAWASLIKVFPLILLLPAATRLARAVVRRDERGGEAARLSVRLLGWSVLALLALAGAALLSGRSWTEFLGKIVVQFQSQGYLLNSVSLSQLLLSIGVGDSPLTTLLSIATLVVLTGMLLRRRDDEAFLAGLPRRSLVLLAAVGWIVQTWFNYYAIAPLLLLPLVARRHRTGAAVAVLATALAFLLPEFDDPLLLERPLLHTLKLLPYVLIPAWLVLIELRVSSFGRRARRAALIAAAVCALATAGEAWRLRAIRQLDDSAGRSLDRGAVVEALADYRRMRALSPGNALARMNEAIALVRLGRYQEAGLGFARAAELAPEMWVTRQNYGRWLLGAENLDAATTELEAALRLAPHDDRILYDLARVRLRQGRPTEAAALLIRARELAPDNRAVAALLAETARP